jgi:hypothetical protein
MKASALKEDVLRRIQEADDQALLQQVKALLDMHAGGRWEGLPDAVRASILEGFAQSERGEGSTHDVVMSKARAWQGK